MWTCKSLLREVFNTLLSSSQATLTTPSFINKDTLKDGKPAESSNIMWSCVRTHLFAGSSPVFTQTDSVCSSIYRKYRVKGRWIVNFVSCTLGGHERWRVWGIFTWGTWMEPPRTYHFSLRWLPLYLDHKIWQVGRCVWFTVDMNTCGPDEPEHICPAKTRTLHQASSVTELMSHQMEARAPVLV